MLEKVLEIGDFRQNKKALKSFKIKEYQGFSVGALQGIRTPDLLVRSFGLNDLLKITACYQML